MTNATDATLGRVTAGASGAVRRPGEEPTLRDLLRAVAEGRWWIVGALAIVMAGAVAYLFLAPPVYRSTTLVQVEEQSTPPVAADTVAALLVEQKVPVEGEMEIMRSRSLLGPIVDELGLDVEAEPRRVLLVGDAVSRRSRAGTLAPPVLGLSRFGWGGERIAVKKFAVSDDLLDEELTLTALGDGRYRLADPDGEVLLEGRVNTAAAAGQGGRKVELTVSELVARPGTEFRIERRRREEAIDGLQLQLRIDEKVKKSGVVAIELELRDPVKAAAVVSGLARAYLRQNIERHSAEAARSLEFLESQLPSVKAGLEASEAALSAFRTKKSTVDLPVQTKTTVERVAELDKVVADLTAERAQLGQRYGDQHPSLVELDRRLDAARATRAAFEPRIQVAPQVEVGNARLVREVNSKAELYLLLLNKAQALRMLKSAATGHARIVDAAFVPRRPVSPKPGPVLLMGAVLGLAVGLALAIARRTMHEGVEDAQVIEAALGLPVFASVPHSPGEVRLSRRGSRGRAALAAAAPDDPGAEHLRTLRTALEFSLKARGNVVAISSPSSGVGKSFVAVNLAHLFAGAGKRVLLVDSDLRRGELHRYFDGRSRPGLADAVAGRVLVDAAIQNTSIAKLDFLACGHLPEYPAELLASGRLQELLARVARRYEVVLLDTPPILAVTDAVLIARCADVNLLVLRSREHPLREIELALERFAQGGLTVHGAILNGARAPLGGYTHAYEHRSQRKPTVKLAG
jgi:tyrosine-protein kinase Etk/Wzc